MEKKNCEECGTLFEYVLNPQFPRKYCPQCSAKKKAEYEAKSQTAQPIDAPVEVVKPYAAMDRQNSIMKQCALKAAVVYCTNKPDVIITDLATELYGWLLNGN